MPQSLAKIYIHAISSTMNREPVLADEWRECLRRYEIEWEERYVWD